MRGHIYGPRGQMDRASSATLYLHGLEQGEFFWTTPVQGASFAKRQANDGHVSVVIDRLGYDSSNKPDGFQSCFGGQAGMAHQIVDQLRSGSYSTRGRATGNSAHYSKVLLGGHSVGGLIAELTASSFKNVDGIVVMSYSSSVVSDTLKGAAAYATSVCQRGGESTEGSAPGGYTFFSPNVAGYRSAFFLSADEESIDIGTERRNRNPCGEVASYNAGTQVNLANAASINVPVLVVIGKEDALFPPPSGPSEAALFTGAPSVRLSELSPSNHGITFEAVAPKLSDDVSDWLDDKGFGRR